MQQFKFTGWPSDLILANYYDERYNSFGTMKWTHAESNIEVNVVVPEWGNVESQKLSIYINMGMVGYNVFLDERRHHFSEYFMYAGRIYFDFIIEHWSILKRGPRYGLNWRAHITY